MPIWIAERGHLGSSCPKKLLENLVRCKCCILALLSISVIAAMRCGSAHALLGSLAPMTHLLSRNPLTMILQRSVHALFDSEPRELNQIYYKQEDFAWSHIKPLPVTTTHSHRSAVFDLPESYFLPKTLKGDKTPAVSQQVRKLNKVLRLLHAWNPLEWSRSLFSQVVWVEVLPTVIFAASHLQEHWLLLLCIHARSSTWEKHGEVLGAELWSSGLIPHSSPILLC